MTGAPAPWTPGGTDISGEKRYAPATVRNRDYIVTVLTSALPARGLVLEIASGSGEHVIHFARAFPALDWQPSDPDPAALASIAAWAGEAALPNVRAPVMLDASTADWPIVQADAILCINMLHISPWEATVGLTRGAAALLPPGGLLFIYGPFVRDEVETAPGNVAFDQSLRERDGQWGLRNLSDVTRAAEAEGLQCETVVEMPANNLSVIYRRNAAG